jgi:transglutaminase-like putative cysteine protease
MSVQKHSGVPNTMIRLNASITLDYLANDQSAFFINIQPVNNQHQSVIRESLVITPTLEFNEYLIEHTGARMLRFVGGPGPIRIAYECTVNISHRIDEPGALFESLPAQLSPEVLAYVFPSRYCESDVLMPFAIQQFGHLAGGYSRVSAIRDWVEANVTFTSGASDWTTSARDTFTRQVGVCRDFAHLMIALCRALNIPARYVTGIDYGADPAMGPHDFHAYVEVFLGNHWYLFDPSGVSPVSGLLRIGTGRDAADTSFANIFGSVQSSSPQISISASENTQLGIEMPENVTVEMAVSTIS